MNETITSAHSSRSRRTVAILTWIGLVVAAALLWRGRLTGAMRTDSSEVVAILLAAYTTFASIFAWMLFSPSRHASEDSLALFFSGGLTLIPSCIIAFCLMPPDSPLRAWLTAGVCLITIIAVMSPIPTEFFGVPRERSSYFRPISEAMFENVEMRHLIDGFDYLRDQVPDARSAVLVHSAPVETAIPGTIARDPWQDPFRGTDVRPAQVESSPKPANSRPANSQPAGNRAPVEPQSHQTHHEPDRRSDRDQVPVMVPRPPVSEDSRVSREPTAERRSIPTEQRTSPEVYRSPKPASSPPPVPKPTAPVAPAPAAPTPAAPMGFVTPTLPAPMPMPAPVSAPVSAPAPAKIDESHYDSAFEQWDSRHAGPEPVSDHDIVSDHDSDESDPGHDHLDDEPLKFERIQDGLGGEMIEGTIRVVFEPGQKRANLHVPFSPPLKGVPDVECEPVGSDDLRLKVPVRQPYGIRIEARRSDASERLETEIGFAAICSHNKK